MFKLIDKKGDNYLVLDTEDGVVDEFDYKSLIIDVLEKGFEVEGCNKIGKHYHFDIDNSNYRKGRKTGWVETKVNYLDSRVGEFTTASNGMRIKIIAYRSAKDIDIQFEDGTIIHNVTYDSFKKGYIRYPNTNLNKIGMISTASNGMKMTLIAYRKSTDIDIQLDRKSVV